MPRRKIFRTALSNLPSASIFAKELSLLDGIIDFDPEEVQIIVKGRKPPLKAVSIEDKIKNLERYMANNRKILEECRYEIIHKRQLAHILKCSRPALDKWIEAGFIKTQPGEFYLCKEVYSLTWVLEQLKVIKNKQQ